MTVSMLIDRLERFHQGVSLYREMCKGDVLQDTDITDALDTSHVEGLRNKLRQQYDHLSDYVTALTKGRWQIHMESGDLQDIYVQAFSGQCREWHVDAIVKDLEQMIGELHTRPLHEPVDVEALRHQDSRHTVSPSISFGSLGHKGYSSTAETSATVEASLRMVARLLQQNSDRQDDPEALQDHIRTLVEHPELTSLFTSPPSRRP